MRRTAWAAALAVGYTFAAGAWVLLSSSLAASSSASLEELERFEELKGLGFVLVTALGLFLSIRFALGRIEATGRELLRRERALIAGERRVFAGLIASSVAHDSNNMLAVVVAELELAKDCLDPETLARIRDAVDQLTRLNRRLVEAGRHVRGTSLQPLDLSAVVRDAVELVRPHPSLRRAAVTVEAPGPVEVSGTPVLVSQIVTNLVVNAGEATGGTGTVTVRVLAADGQARLEVQDDGPGIAPERRPGLFDALVTTKADGNGMGLFSVKAAAHALGGGATVDEAPGGGALFRVTLPLRKPS